MVTMAQFWIGLHSRLKTLSMIVELQAIENFVPIIIEELKNL